MNSVGGLARRHWQLIVFILGLVFVFWLLWVLRNVLLPFVVGFILAYLLLPIIRWVERRRLPIVGKKPKLRQLRRISAIAVVYLLALAVIGLAVFYVITTVGKAFGTLTQDASQIIPNGLDTDKSNGSSLSHCCPIHRFRRILTSMQRKSAVALPGVLMIS